MRLVLSHGQVNIYSLAKNASTSVNQRERFYAKRLPISKELMENLQSVTPVALTFCSRALPNKRIGRLVLPFPPTRVG